MFSITTILGLAMAFAPVPEKEEKGKPIAVVNHSGYFVSNKAKLPNKTEFRTIHDKKSFDALFGVGFVMGDSSDRLAPNAFDSRWVIAVIKSDSRLYKYKVRGLSAKGKVLTLKYDALPQPKGAAKFRSPLILSVEKGDYDSVEFIEGDKKVATLKLKK